MSQSLPYDEIKFETSVSLQKILNTPDNSDIGYFLKVDLGYPNKGRQKTRHFPFALEIKLISTNVFNDYMKKIEPKNYKSHKKLICDGTDKKKYLIHYRMLKFYVKHG